MDAINRTLWNEKESNVLMNAWRDEYKRKTPKKKAWINIHRSVKIRAKSIKTLDQCKRKIWNHRKLYREALDQIKQQEDHVASGGKSYPVFKPPYFDIFDQVFSQCVSLTADPFSVSKEPAVSVSENTKRKQGRPRMSSSTRAIDVAGKATKEDNVEQQQKLLKTSKKRKLEILQVTETQPKTLITIAKQPKLISSTSYHSNPQHLQQNSGGCETQGTPSSNKNTRIAPKAGSFRGGVDSEVASAAAASIDTMDLDLYFDEYGRIIEHPDQSPPKLKSKSKRSIAIKKNLKRSSPSSSVLLSGQPNPLPNPRGVKLLLPPKPIVLRYQPQHPQQMSPVVFMGYK